MKKLSRIAESFKVFFRRITDNPDCLPNYFKLAFYYFFGTDRLIPYYDKIRILSADETIDHLIANRRSFLRLGTGEAQIGLGMGFYAGRSAQRAHRLLVRRMNETLEQDKVLVGLGARFLRASDAELKTIGKWSMFLRNRVWLHGKLKKDRIYGEAFAFREDFDIAKVLNYLKTKRLVIVSRPNPNIDAFAVGLEKIFIEGPVQNAFEDYGEIFSRIKQAIAEHKLSPDNTLFLIALGPAAKALAMDIDSLGFMAWDIGAFFENFIFEKVKKYL